MMKLLNALNKKVLVENLEVANTLWTRARGLLGRNSLAEDQALWILASGSIHTFFMKFPIDVVFLDRDMVVTKTATEVTPFRFVWKGFRAASVIELKAGFLKKTPINVGDKLYVDHTIS